MATAGASTVFSSNIRFTCSEGGLGSSIYSGACEGSQVLFFQEQQRFTLIRPVTIDIGSTPGLYDSTSQLLSGVVLPTGSVVTSYFIHFDPIGQPTKAVNPDSDPSLPPGVAQITFDDAFHLLGIQVLAGTQKQGGVRHDSTQLRVGDLIYDETNSPGVELGNDWIRILDAHTIQFKLDVNSDNVDDFRILGEAPEPGSLSLIGIGLVGFAAFLRRTRK